MRVWSILGTGTGAATISMIADGPVSFLDTNILVYAFEKASSPKKRVAERLVNELIDQDRLRTDTRITDTIQSRLKQ